MSAYSVRLAWIEREGDGVEKSRIELIENKLILDQLYSTLLYFSSLPFNPNRSLKLHEQNLCMLKIKIIMILTPCQFGYLFKFLPIWVCFLLAFDSG